MSWVQIPPAAPSLNPFPFKQVEPGPRLLTGLCSPLSPITPVTARVRRLLLEALQCPIRVRGLAENRPAKGSLKLAREKERMRSRAEPRRNALQELGENWRPEPPETSERGICQEWPPVAKAAGLRAPLTASGKRVRVLGEEDRML